jgi:hypothetical protein
VNLYRKYTCDYLEKERHDSSGTRYDINLEMYDWYYLDFCSLSIENLYSYWERIGYFLFQFFPPTKVVDNNLSFQNLISCLKKDIKQGKYHSLHTSQNFKWFSEFTEKGHEFEKLQKYRHPLIHYKFENQLFKGGLNSGTYSFLIKNCRKREKIEELQKVNDSLVDFINHQFSLCYDGYLKTVDLIKEINNVNVNTTL